MKGLDGIQGPVYVGTGCVFRRQALYGYSPPKGPKRQKMVSCDCYPYFGRRKKPRLDKNDNELLVDGDLGNLQPCDIHFNGARWSSSLIKPPTALLKESIHIISCGYEDKTEWGIELGWIYGSITEDIFTGFKMQCMPKRLAFKGSAPINLSDRLNHNLPFHLTPSPCLLYPTRGLPPHWKIHHAIGKFLSNYISTFASLFFIALFISIFSMGILKLRWSGVSIEEWWRNEQFWVIGGVFAHLFAVVQGFLKILAGIDTNITVTSKASDDEEFGELYTFKWITLLIPPTTILIINVVGVMARISDAINNGYQSLGPLFGKLFFSFWLIVHLYPFLKGLMGRQNQTSMIVVI
ncbi:hypothetical protein M5K25_027549 [Dendrobium thyrsiflorum]|uniref:Cellulose synthase n=1 Tax=Dendrobium thyrsiflorum TaxID=117978 RepID=A0ABD0TU56_DENTH